MNNKIALAIFLLAIACQIIAQDYQVEITLSEGAFNIVNREIPKPGEKIKPLILKVSGTGNYVFTANNIFGKKIDWEKKVILNGASEIPFDAGMGYYEITASKGREKVVAIKLGIVPPYHPGVRKRSFFCSNTSHIRLGEELELLQRIGIKVQRVHIASEGEGRNKNATILDTLKQYDGWILPIVGYSLGERSEWAKKYNQHGPPADFSYFVSEWEKIVRDFSEVDVWEFWNEPWIFGWSWADTPFRYRELQTLWCNMALKVNPGNEIIVGNSWMFTMDHIKPYPDCWQNGLVQGSSHHPYVDNAFLNWRSGAYQRSLDATCLLNRSMGLKYTYVTEGGASVASPHFDNLKLSEFESPNNILNAAKIPELFAYNALAGIYQSNMQWDIGYGRDWTMSNTSFGVFTHFTEDRPVLVDVWPENELIQGAIFAHPQFISDEIKKLPRANEINARWEVEVPGGYNIDRTKVAFLWSLTGKDNFHLDEQSTITIANAKGLTAFDMMANEIPAKNGKLVLPFGQYPVYVTTDDLSVMELYERINSAVIENITAVNYYACSLTKSPQEKQQLRVRIKNQVNVPVHVKLEVKIEGNKQKLVQEAKLPAAKLIDVFIDWPGVELNAENQYPVSIFAEVTSNDKKMGAFQRSQLLQQASFARKKITIDGNSNDWSEQIPVTLEAVSEADESKYLLNPSLKKPAELEDEKAAAQLYTAYDDEYVYFCMKGWGNQTRIGAVAKSGLELWKKGEPDGLDHPADCGDVLQIAFGFRERVPHIGRQMGDLWEWKGHYYDTDYQYAIFKDAKGNDQVVTQWGPDTDRRTAYQIDLVPYVKNLDGAKVKITDDCYEIAIPRSELKLFNPEQGQFRFDFMLNGKFQWAASVGVFDFWKSNGTYSPSWTTTKPAQDFWGIEQ